MQRVWYDFAMADRKLYTSDIADLLGITESTWRSYCTESGNRRRQAPPADGVDNDQGHARQWWWETTIQRWQDERPGRGRSRDPGTRREPAPQLDSPRREDERSLWLNYAVAGKIVQDPQGVIERAHERLRDLRQAHSHGRSDKWLDRWQQILDDGPDAVLEIMTARTDEAQALRSASPLPTDLLSTEERSAILAAFRTHWRSQHRHAA